MELRGIEIMLLAQENIRLNLLEIDGAVLSLVVSDSFLSAYFFHSATSL